MDKPEGRAKTETQPSRENKDKMIFIDLTCGSSSPSIERETQQQDTKQEFKEEQSSHDSTKKIAEESLDEKKDTISSDVADNRGLGDIHKISSNVAARELGDVTKEMIRVHIHKILSHNDKKTVRRSTVCRLVLNDLGIASSSAIEHYIRDYLRRLKSAGSRARQKTINPAPKLNPNTYPNPVKSPGSPDKPEGSRERERDWFSEQTRSPDKTKSLRKRRADFSFVEGSVEAKEDKKGEQEAKNTDILKPAGGSIASLSKQRRIEYRPVCLYCGKTLKTTNHAIKHMKLAHKNIKYFRCRCGERFESKESLKHHIQMEDPMLHSTFGRVSSSNQNPIISSPLSPPFNNPPPSPSSNDTLVNSDEDSNNKRPHNAPTSTKQDFGDGYEECAGTRVQGERKRKRRKGEWNERKGAQRTEHIPKSVSDWRVKTQNRVPRPTRNNPRAVYHYHNYIARIVSKTTLLGFRLASTISEFLGHEYYVSKKAKDGERFFITDRNSKLEGLASGIYDMFENDPMFNILFTTDIREEILQNGFPIQYARLHVKRFGFKAIIKALHEGRYKGIDEVIGDVGNTFGAYKLYSYHKEVEKVLSKAEVKEEYERMNSTWRLLMQLRIQPAPTMAMRAMWYLGQEEGIVRYLDNSENLKSNSLYSDFPIGDRIANEKISKKHEEHKLSTFRSLKENMDGSISGGYSPHRFAQALRLVFVQSLTINAEGSYPEASLRMIKCLDGELGRLELPPFDIPEPDERRKEVLRKEKERLAKEAEEREKKEAVAKEAEKEKKDKERVAREAEDNKNEERVGREAEEKKDKGAQEKVAEQKKEKIRLAREAEERKEKVVKSHISGSQDPNQTRSQFSGTQNVNHPKNNVTGSQNPTGSQILITGSQNPLTGSQNLITVRQKPITESQSPITGSQNTITGSQNPISGNQNTITGSQSPISGSQNTITGSQNPISGSQNTITGSQSPISGSQNTITGSQNPITGSQNTITGSQSPITGSQNTITRSQKPITGSQNTITRTQNPITGTQNPITGSQNPITGSQNPITGTQNPITGSQNPITGSQNTITGTQNPITGSQNPITGSQNTITGTQNPITGTQNPVTGSKNPTTGSQNPKHPSSHISGNKDPNQPLEFEEALTDVRLLSNLRRSISQRVNKNPTVNWWNLGESVAQKYGLKKSRALKKFVKKTYKEAMDKRKRQAERNSTGSSVLLDTTQIMKLVLLPSIPTHIKMTIEGEQPTNSDAVRPRNEDQRGFGEEKGGEGNEGKRGTDGQEGGRSGNTRNKMMNLMPRELEAVQPVDHKIDPANAVSSPTDSPLVSNPSPTISKTPQVANPENIGENPEINAGASPGIPPVSDASPGGSQEVSVPGIVRMDVEPVDAFVGVSGETKFSLSEFANGSTLYLPEGLCPEELEYHRRINLSSGNNHLQESIKLYAERRRIAMENIKKAFAKNLHLTSGSQGDISIARFPVSCLIASFNYKGVFVIPGIGFLAAITFRHPSLQTLRLGAYPLEIAAAEAYDYGVRRLGMHVPLSRQLNNVDSKSVTANTKSQIDKVIDKAAKKMMQLILTRTTPRPTNTTTEHSSSGSVRSERGINQQTTSSEPTLNPTIRDENQRIIDVINSGLDGILEKLKDDCKISEKRKAILAKIMKEIIMVPQEPPESRNAYMGWIMDLLFFSSERNPAGEN
ncbi:hypothetical protein AAMO2058_000570300 [Amorphochlora amoebiformis]